MHTERRTVDINKQAARMGQVQPIILRRGETGQTQIEIAITSDQAPYSVADYTAWVCAYLPDGKFMKDATHVSKSSNQVTYTVHSDLTSAPGDVRIFYVELRKGEELLTTDAIPLIILDDISLSDEVADEYQSTIDAMLEQVESLIQSINDKEQAVGDAEAERKANEQARQSNETQRQSNEGQRQANESARQSKEDARGEAETKRVTAEAERVRAELERVTAEAARVQAELARAQAEAARVTEQAKNNADQAANNLAAAQIAPHVCVSGEHADGKPTVEGSVEGRIYLVPTGGSGDDRYTEWMWLGGQWERVGTSSGGDIAYISTDQIDAVAKDEQPSGDTVLSLTGLSYLWAKVKAWASGAFRKVDDTISPSDITGTIPVSNGGTGATSLASNQVLLGNGSSAVKATSASGAGALYRTGASSAPAFGTLPLEQGGTGQTSLDGAKDALGISALEDAWDSISLTVRTVTGDIASVGSNSATLDTVTVPLESGETFLGVVGFAIGAGALLPYRVRKTAYNQVQYSARNVAATAQTGTYEIHCLIAKGLV